MRHLLHLACFGLFCVCTLVLSRCGLLSPSTRPTGLQTRSGLLAPVSLQEAALLGTWENVFTEYHTEVLILTSDHQFVQHYQEVGSNARRFTGQGTWHIERRASGCVYVHLEGMRYFYGAEAFALYGNRFTPHGEPYRFWERCEERYIPMPDKVIFIVASRPTWPRGIGLVFPATSKVPTSAEEMILQIDSGGQPVPRATRERP